MKEEIKKIKIGTLDVKINQVEYLVQAAIEEFNGSIKQGFESIGIILTEDSLRDYFESASLITTQFETELQQNLSKFPIVSSRAMFEQSATGDFSRFMQTRREFLYKYQPDIRKYISLDNKAAVLSQSAKDQITEDFTVFISDPEEIELYNKHIDACNALNQLFEGYHKLDWNRLFDFENGKFTPNIFIQYDVLLNHIKKSKNGK